MKTKLISLLLCITLTSTFFMGCGSNANSNSSKTQNVPDALLVTINDKTYDLSKNFHEVVGKMVKNELGVFDMRTGYNYSDEGYYETDKDKRIRIGTGAQDKFEGIVYALPTNDTAGGPGIFDHIKNHAYCNHYEFMIGFSTFKNGEGISCFSSKEDLEALSDYIPYHDAKIMKTPGFAAVYFDDQAVDLNKYEMDYVSFKEEYEYNQSLDSKDPNKQWYNYVINSIIGSSNLGDFDKYDTEIVLSEIAVTKALQDGASKLKNGEIKNLSAVLYTVNGDYTDLDVYVYTNDYIYSSKEMEEKKKE